MTTIINPELPKPTYLMMMYDSIWETQNSLMVKLELLLLSATKTAGRQREFNDEDRKRILTLTNGIEQSKIALREADQAIHDYIISHNTENKYLKIA